MTGATAISDPPDAGASGLHSIMGAKAAGLLSLPREWVPAWTVERDGMPRAIARQLRSVDDVIAAADRWVLIRSNAPEGRERPAEGRTELVAADHAAVYERLRIVSAPESWPLVQAALEPVLLGVMSNERRVSPRADEWVVEAPIGLLDPEVTRVRATRGSRPARLTATTVGDLLRRFRQLAGELNRCHPGRDVRCEWGWDGRALWVLQADVQGPLPSGGSSWLDGIQSQWPPRERSVRLSRGWPKLEKAHMFESLGWPSVASAVVPGDQWTAGKAIDELRRQDLLPGQGRPVALRTDLRSADLDSPLLPTSPPIEDLDDLLDAMARAARHFAEHHVDERRWAFLVADWVPSRAGAWVNAEPGSWDVRIDALWGHPDGIQTLPHDTYEVGTRESGVDARVRYKPTALRADSHGWTYASVGQPWDWKRVMTDEEATHVAGWARQLADEIRRPTQLLVLLQVGGRRGSAGCLPFFFSNLTVPPTAGALPTRRTHVTVRRREDIQRIVGTEALIELQLDADCLRDIDLHKDIADRARLHDVPILLHGSRLGHIFYVLRANGARVHVADEASGAMPSVCCLVRSERDIDRVVSLDLSVVLKATQHPPPDVSPDASGVAVGMIERLQRTSRARRAFQHLPTLAADAIGAAELSKDVLGQAGSFLTFPAGGSGNRGCQPPERRRAF